MNNFAGTAGYREVLDRFMQASESVDFEVLHTGIMHLIPTEPCRMLDVGAGSGRDAAALAVMGPSALELTVSGRPPQRPSPWRKAMVLGSLCI